jgi:hypothetical protein
MVADASPAPRPAAGFVRVTPTKAQRQRRKQLHWEVIRQLPPDSIWRQLPAPGAAPAQPGVQPAPGARLQALFTLQEHQGAARLAQRAPKRVALLEHGRAHNICIRLAGAPPASQPAGAPRRPPLPWPWLRLAAAAHLPPPLL